MQALESKNMMWRLQQLGSPPAKHLEVFPSDSRATYAQHLLESSRLVVGSPTGRFCTNFTEKKTEEHLEEHSCWHFP